MEIVLKIDGMTCGGCVSSVRKVLMSVPSVKTVDVDLAAGRATVSADGPVDSAALISAVEDAGYGAEIGRAA